jgi:hypothetical protein
MDQKLLDKTIQELRRRKHQIDQVILMLETLGTGKPRRGRPPKLLAETLAAIGEADSPKRAVKKREKPAS